MESASMWALCTLCAKYTSCVVLHSINSILPKCTVAQVFGNIPKLANFIQFRPTPSPSSSPLISET